MTPREIHVRSLRTRYVHASNRQNWIHAEVHWHGSTMGFTAHFCTFKSHSGIRRPTRSRSSRSRLAVRRHAHCRFRMLGVLTSPQARDRLCLRVKVDTRFAVKGVCPAARNTPLVARKAEHGKRYSLALMSSMASSRVSTFRQTRTGPKISSL